MDRRAFVRSTASAGVATALIAIPRAWGDQNPGTDRPPVPMPLYLPAPGFSGQTAGQVFVDTPQWARLAPGLYAPNTLTAGSGLLNFRHETMLQFQLHNSFTELPSLLGEAKAFGTNIIYLMDWYVRHTANWSVKGDYIVSDIMGGADALRLGLQGVHNNGGRVIFYIEALNISNDSEIASHQDSAGRANAQKWSIVKDRRGTLLPSIYPNMSVMCPNAEGWAAHLEGVARTLASLGADGLYLDSYGDPDDLPCYSGDHGHPAPSGDPAAAKASAKALFATGEGALARRLRAAMQPHRPEGVIVITEGSVDRPNFFAAVDGALDWGMFSFVKLKTWDAQGSTDTFIPGFSVDDWNQAVAIGAKLAVPKQLFEPLPGMDAPPGHQVTRFLDASFAAYNSDPALSAQLLFLGLHKWRNAGLILGLAMPSFGDLVTTTAQRAVRHYAPFPLALGDTDWQRLRDHALHIDAAFVGLTPMPTSDQMTARVQAYMYTLMTARRAIAAIVDNGASVTQINASSPLCVGWKFVRPDGQTVLTAVSTDDRPHRIALPAAGGGSWHDHVSGDSFPADGGMITVNLAPHSVRLMTSLGVTHVPRQPPSGARPRF